jgi:hypothetical protein
MKEQGTWSAAVRYNAESIRSLDVMSALPVSPSIIHFLAALSKENAAPVSLHFPVDKM